MILRKRASLTSVVSAVARVLRDGGFRAVLTGGANAALYSGGTFQSFDLDFVLLAGGPRAALDEAMRRIDYQRRHDIYISPSQDYQVEFPPGPLAIGTDIRIRPFRLRLPGGTVMALSPTDSCLDRLAAWIHWHDRSSRDVALQIALQNRVSITRIRTWCRREGAAAEGELFLADRRARMRRRKPR